MKRSIFAEVFTFCAEGIFSQQLRMVADLAELEERVEDEELAPLDPEA